MTDRDVVSADCEAPQLLLIRDVHGNGIPNGNAIPNGNGNKTRNWKWEVIVRPLSTVGYTIVAASAIHSRQRSN